MLEFLFQHSGYEPMNHPTQKTQTRHCIPALSEKIFRLSSSCWVRDGYVPHQYRLSCVLGYAVEAGEVFLDMLLSRGADIHSKRLSSPPHMHMVYHLSRKRISSKNTSGKGRASSNSRWLFL